MVNLQELIVEFSKTLSNYVNTGENSTLVIDEWNALVQAFVDTGVTNA